METTGNYQVDNETESSENDPSARAKEYLSLLKDTRLDPWEPTLNLRENIDRLFEQSLHLPKPDIQLPYLKALAVLPTMLIDYAPRVDLFGPEGSGKSQTLHILCALRHHNSTEPLYLTAGSTPVAVRNFINKNRGESRSLRERNFVMGIDNIETIDKKSLWYLLMLSGYKRSSADIQVSSSIVGENLQFNCFAPMVWTTVFRITNHPEYRELRRRQDTIIFEKMTDVSKEMLDVSVAELTQFASAISSLWHWDSPGGLDNCKEFIGLFKKLKRPKISGERWQIVNSLVATLIFCGWFDEKTALEWIVEFFNKQKTILNSGQISLVINQIVYEYCGTEIAFRAKGTRVPLRLPTKILVEKVKTAVANGQLTLHKTVNQEISNYMENDGWIMDLKNGGGYWVKE